MQKKIPIQAQPDQCPWLCCCREFIFSARYKALVSIPQLQSEKLKAQIRASSIPTFQQAIQPLQVCLF
ncbi:hypothetical protein IHE45_10G027800 [Dioscorea alata]|uniref:Uncharacterized protein n=1 Tax=Dioscorea alata TaxID=55571 RepID=A0ACB7V9W4_DIOAL|nr:hypothetical protein IHE45_10G027800 [Dioscorea alata]